MKLRVGILLAILILLTCIGVVKAKVEGEYRVNLSLLILGWTYPGEEIKVQVTTFLDRYKPLENEQPPSPLNPGDLVYIGNVPVRFEVRNEHGRIVNLDIPQNMTTDSTGFLEFTF